MGVTVVRLKLYDLCELASIVDRTVPFRDDSRVDALVSLPHLSSKDDRLDPCSSVSLHVSPLVTCSSDVMADSLDGKYWYQCQ